jgi:hypothetical protein
MKFNKIIMIFDDHQDFYVRSLIRLIDQLSELKDYAWHIVLAFNINFNFINGFLQLRSV